MTETQHVFQVGEEVAFKSSGWDNSYQIAVIERITPSGRIKIDKSSGQFRPQGYECGDGYNRSHIYPLNDKLRETCAIHALAKQAEYLSREFNGKHWRNMKREVLEKVVPLLQEVEKIVKDGNQ